jgi:hypothetical protein
VLITVAYPLYRSFVNTPRPEAAGDSLQAVLAAPRRREAFRQFLVSEFSAENLIFFEEVSELADYYEELKKEVVRHGALKLVARCCCCCCCCAPLPLPLPLTPALALAAPTSFSPSSASAPRTSSPSSLSRRRRSRSISRTPRDARVNAWPTRREWMPKKDQKCLSRPHRFASPSTRTRSRPRPRRQPRQAMATP